jgi:hypothetical protein
VAARVRGACGISAWVRIDLRHNIPDDRGKKRHGWLGFDWPLITLALVVIVIVQRLRIAELMHR